jgi:hypothetical protein
MDLFHLACGIVSVLFAIAGALLLWRESDSKTPPSHLSYLFPRVLLVGALLGCIENAALVSLSMLDDSFSPAYYDAFTISADTAADFLVLTGAFALASPHDTLHSGAQRHGTAAVVQDFARTSAHSQNLPDLFQSDLRRLHAGMHVLHYRIQRCGSGRYHAGSKPTIVDSTDLDMVVCI